MNKLVLAAFVGLYMVSPAPSVGELLGHASQRIDSAFATEPPTFHPLEVSINGGVVTPAPARTVREGTAKASCERSMNWSFQKMLAGAFTDECDSQAARSHTGGGQTRGYRGV